VSAFGEIAVAFQTIAAIIALLRESKDLLPDGDAKRSLEQRLEKAERESKLAEAQIAQALGYELCKCDFPPQIMRSLGYRELGETFECPRCHRVFPPPGSGQPEFVEDFEP